MKGTADATHGYRSVRYLRFRLSSLVAAAETAAEDSELCAHLAQFRLIRDPTLERALRSIAKAARLAASRAKDRADELDWSGTQNATIEAQQCRIEARAALSGMFNARF